MRIEYVTDPELFREVGEQWLAESRYEQFGLKVTVDNVIADSKEWLKTGMGTIIALHHGYEGYVGFMTVYCVADFLGDKPVAFEKYWYIKPMFRWGGHKMLAEAKIWAKKQGASHFVSSASMAASNRHDRLCEFYVRQEMKQFETSFICEL